MSETAVCDARTNKDKIWTNIRKEAKINKYKVINGNIFTKYQRILANMIYM